MNERRLQFERHADDLFANSIQNNAMANVFAIAATADGVFYDKGFTSGGDSDDRVMSADTVFWIMSMTKLVTAVACLQLIEKGKLRLDQPAGDIIPALKSRDILEGFDNVGQPKLRSARMPMTIRHLLTHTSGYSYTIWSENLSRYEKVVGLPNVAMALVGALEAPLEFEPGERWAYGISMDWIGRIIEEVTGQSLEVYFRENIFAPLGMDDTGFLLTSSQRRRLVKVHQRNEDGSLMEIPFEVPQRPQFFMGGGGLFSTPCNYIRFLRMILNGGILEEQRILEKETVDMMFHNHLGDISINNLISWNSAYTLDVDHFASSQSGWGLSFDLSLEPGQHGRSSGSGYWAGLLNTHFWLDPAKGVTGAMFTQLLPFYDTQVMRVFGEFESCIYRFIDGD